MKLGHLCIIAAVVLGTSPARAGELPALPQAQVVSDDTLSQIRGMYVPAASSRIAVPPRSIVRDAAGPAALTVTQSATLAQANTVNPLSNIANQTGTVTYFGVDMVSTWTQAGGGGAHGVSAGLDMGFDLAHGQVTVGEWSSSTNGGLTDATPSGTIGGSGTSNVSSGVGQNIQIAGNGNTITNTATVTVGSVDSAIIVPTTNTCGTQCTISIGPDGAQVAIATAQGSVLQTIGPNGILQSAQVSSDMNTISNQLGVRVQVSHVPSFNAGSLLPILQTLTGLP